MLRPATPLSALLFAAFALLLISVLSVPILKAIPLGTYEGVNFGVFGYCDATGDCTKIAIGYDTSKAITTTGSSGFDLPTSTRTTLSAILVVHPVAALITLIMFILAVTAHLHSPSHSSRYLLCVFIMSIVDLLICLLSFLIDVLLFAPHLAWGSYLVLAAAILVALGSLVSCAMRRTLVNRKARKKRIAENAEMSGENFYNRQAQTAGPTTRQPTVPAVSGAAAGGDKLPQFASFEKKKDDQTSDERVPLTARSPSDRSATNGLPGDASSGAAGDPYNRRSPGQRDQYGNPVSPQDGFGVQREPSFDRMRGRGGMGAAAGYRGRGGYNGRGGYGPPPNGRGGYGPGRGGYGPPGGRGGYGPPPRGYGGPMRGGRPPPPGYQGGPGGPPGPYDRRGGPGNPYTGPYGGQATTPGGASNISGSMPSLTTATSYEAYNPERGSLPRAESPPPLPGEEPAGQTGQAIEMDASTGSPAHTPQGFGQFGTIRDSDADVAGMVGLQQARASGHMSDGSKYSSEEPYVPPRAGWNAAQGRNSPAGRSSPRMPSPLNLRTSPPPQPTGSAAGHYYEDVDPRFEPAGGNTTPRPLAGPVAPPARPMPPPIHTATIPSAYDDEVPRGARSPAESERSNLTSISQRGVNPHWNPSPPPQMPGARGAMVPPRRPVNRSDGVLNSNPDFELSSARGSPPRGGGMIPGSAYPTGPI